MSTAAATPAAQAPTAEEEARTRRIDRLIERSADGHDAYADVDWDQVVDPEDPRLRLFSFDPLARTDWYRQLPGPRQSEVGLLRIATSLRIGWEFENLLQQGLLNHAWRMRNTNASFRYLHTEVMEESQHTLMFYEFVRRHAPHVLGMSGFHRTIADPAVFIAARRLPALFYFMVLGGEIPVDHLQRRAIAEEQLHPLLNQIMAIHVEEEARHVAFANTEIRRLVPQMSETSRQALALAIPAVLTDMARLMVYPSRWLVRYYEVPRRDLRRALKHPESRQLLVDSVARIRKVCDSLDLVTRPSHRLWEAAGLV